MIPRRMTPADQLRVRQHAIDIHALNRWFKVPANDNYQTRHPDRVVPEGATDHASLSGGQASRGTVPDCMGGVQS